MIRVRLYLIRCPDDSCLFELIRCPDNSCLFESERPIAKSEDVNGKKGMRVSGAWSTYS
jgi:hypothetical protein